MLSTIFRRSSAASRQTLAAAATLYRSPLPIPSNSAAFVVSDAEFAPKARSCGSTWRRGFHSGPGGLGFRAGDVLRAQFAVDDLYEEDKGGKKGDEGLEIAGLGISKEIVSKLASKGITRLFPIQRAVLEPAMQGRDLIGRARTGTGKTLAFGIPVIDNILRFQAKNGRGRNPVAVVLAPTRELARQVEKEFRESSPLDTLCVYGGSPINQQARALNYGVDVVVGTPGRMIDLMNRGSLILSDVQHIVLDEADQMLAVGFAEDVEKILEKLPQKRHSMMFSATMPSWIRKLTQKYLNNPLTIDLVGDSDQKLAEGITLYSIATDNYNRASILAPLIKEHAKGGKCIVFTQTKRDADRLSYAMSRSLQCEALHGDIAQNQRERTLAGFRDGRFNTLIATDVAARGLDIPNVDLVIHYEIPNTSELFVHRSGRTGRAGKKGSAILIYTCEQQRLVRGIEHDVGCKFAELPKIAVEGGGDLFDSMSGGRGDSFGGGRGFGRSGSYGGSSFGNPRGSGGFGGPSGRYGESGSGRFGGSASGSSSSFGRSGGFGNRGQGGFGYFGNTDSSRFGSFGDSSSGRSGGFGNSAGSGFSGSSFGSSNFGGTGSFGKSGKSSFGSFRRYDSDE